MQLNSFWSFKVSMLSGICGCWSSQKLLGWKQSLQGKGKLEDSLNALPVTGRGLLLVYKWQSSTAQPATSWQRAVQAARGAAARPCCTPALSPRYLCSYGTKQYSHHFSCSTTSLLTTQQFASTIQAPSHGKNPNVYSQNCINKVVLQNSRTVGNTV